MPNITEQQAYANPGLLNDPANRVVSGGIDVTGDVQLYIQQHPQVTSVANLAYETTQMSQAQRNALPPQELARRGLVRATAGYDFRDGRSFERPLRADEAEALPLGTERNGMVLTGEGGKYYWGPAGYTGQRLPTFTAAGTMAEARKAGVDVDLSPEERAKAGGAGGLPEGYQAKSDKLYADIHAAQAAELAATGKKSTEVYWQSVFASALAKNIFPEQAYEQIEGEKPGFDIPTSGYVPSVTRPYEGETAQQFYDRLITGAAYTPSEAVAKTRQAGFKLFGVDTTTSGPRVLGSMAGIETPLVVDKANNIKLADGTWLALSDWNKLSPEYQRIGLTLGYDALTAQIDVDNELATAIRLRSVELPDGKMMSKEDYDKLPLKYRQLAAKEGYDAVVQAIKTDEAEFNAKNKVIGNQAMPLDEWNKLDKEYQIIAEESGFDVMNKAIDADVKLAEERDKKLADATLMVSAITRPDAKGNYDLNAIAVAIRDGRLKKEDAYAVFGDKRVVDEAVDEVSVVPFGVSQLQSMPEGEIKDMMRSYYQSLKAYPDQLQGISFSSIKDYMLSAPVKFATDIAAEVGSFVPGIGTIIRWNDMNDTERSLSLALDMAILAGPLVRFSGGRLIKAIDAIPGAKLGKIVPKSGAGLSVSAVRRVVKEATLSILKKEGGIGVVTAAEPIISKAEARALFKQAGLSNRAVDQLTRNKVLAKITGLPKSVAQRVIEDIKGVNAAITKQVEARAAVAIAKETKRMNVPLTASEQRAAFVKSGLEPSTAKALTTSYPLRIVSNAVDKVVSTVKSANTKLIDNLVARGEQIGAKYAPSNVLSKSETRALYRSAGLSESQIKNLMRSKVLSHADKTIRGIVKAQKRATATVLKSIESEAMSQGGRIATKFTKVESLTKAESRKLFLSAGLSKEQVDVLMRNKALTTTDRITRKVAGDLSKFIKRQNEQFIRNLDAKVASSTYKFTRRASLTNAEVRQIYRSAGLTNSQINGIMGSKTFARISKSISDSWKRSLEYQERKVADIVAKAQAKPDIRMPRADKARLLKDAGLNKSQIDSILQNKGIRITKKVARDLYRATTSGMDKIRKDAAAGYADALRELNIKEVKAPRGSLASALSDIRRAVQTNDTKLLKAGAKRLELAAGRIPKQLGGGMLVTQARLMQGRPAMVIKLAKKASGNTANEGFIRNAEEALKRVKDPGRREAIKEAIKVAKKQQKVAIQTKQVSPLQEVIWPEQQGKNLPAVVERGTKKLVKVKVAGKPKEVPATTIVKVSRPSIITKTVPFVIPAVRPVTTGSDLGLISFPSKEGQEAFVKRLMDARMGAGAVYPLTNKDTDILRERITELSRSMTVAQATRLAVDEASGTATSEKYKPAFRPGYKNLPQHKGDTKILPKPDTLAKAMTLQQVKTETKTQVKTDTKVRTETKPVTEVKPATELQPATKTKPVTKTKVEIKPKPKPRPPIRIPFPEIGGGATGQRKVPEGALAWKQGIFWKYIPAPWTNSKPKTLPRGTVPIGARVGGRTPAETIQIIGEPGARVPQAVSVDLGVVDIYIFNGRDIRFSGRGEQTDVGESLSETGTGMSIPAVARDFGHHRQTRHSVSKTSTSKRRTIVSSPSLSTVRV